MALLTACLGSLVGTSRSATQKQAAGAANSEAEEDVRETVFRYQFKSVSVQVSYYFISVDNKNPSPALLDRFREDQPEVRPASDAHYEKKPVAGYVDKRSDKQGILFRQGAIHWISNTQADVEGSYECGELCDPAAGTYHVTREAGRWTVNSFDAAKTAKSGT